MKNPEYVKFKNNWFEGNKLEINKIYKWLDLTNGKNESYLELNPDFFDNWTKQFEVSTKEKFDAQNQPKFEVGKWYKNLGFSENHIGKFSGWYSKGVMSVSDYIFDNRHRGKSDNFTSDYKNAELLTDLSEIQQYLPEGHPDLIKTKSMKINEFKKGDYVVLLASCNGGNCWEDSIPINYCYKLKEDSNSHKFLIIRDNNGNISNGWSAAIDYNSKLDIRAATPEEIAEYDRLGEPYDVTTLNKKESKSTEFVKGKWYTCSCNRNLYRFHRLNNQYFEHDGVINLGNSNHGGCSPGLSEELHTQSLAEYFNPLNLADMNIVNQYVVKEKSEKWVPKVGDWVIVTERHSSNDSEVGHIAQIKSIDNSDTPYLLYNSPNFSSSSWCRNVRKAEPHEIPIVVKNPTENIVVKNYTAEEALAELKRRGFKEGCKYTYMYSCGTYDEFDTRISDKELLISSSGSYIDCGAGYLWHIENPSHLHRGPISESIIGKNPHCPDRGSYNVYLPPSQEPVSLKKPKNFLNPASLLPKIKQLPINK